MNWVETVSGERNGFCSPPLLSFGCFLINMKLHFSPVPRDWHTNMMKVWQSPATICLIRYPNAQQYVLPSAQLPPWRSFHYSHFPYAYIATVLLGLLVKMRTVGVGRWDGTRHDLGDVSWSLSPQRCTFSSQGYHWLTQKVLPARLSSASPKMYPSDTRFPEGPGLVRSE